MAAIVLVAPAVAAAGTLDQSQTSFSGFVSLGETRQAAQTFTAGIDGHIDQVDVHIRREAPVSDMCTPGSGITAEVRTISGGVPTDTVLAASNVPGSNVPFSFDWVSFSFAAPAAVAAGTQYALVLSATDASCTGFFFPYSWGLADGDPYPAGASFLRTDPTSSWMVQGTYDALFKTYVVPAEASDPAPTVQITKQPKDKVKTKKKRAKATFEFSGTDARAIASFQCSLDGGAFAPCTSPHTVKVKKGKHSFAVRAVDQAGNVSAPASDDWKVKRKKKK